MTERYESVETTFQRIVESGNEVVVALTHKAKNSNTWLGFDGQGCNMDESDVFQIQ